MCALQVVIIAAGYDTRAYRLSKPGVRFYEIDLPHASTHKQDLVRKLLPANKVCVGRRLLQVARAAAVAFDATATHDTGACMLSCMALLDLLAMLCIVHAQGTTHATPQLPPSPDQHCGSKSSRHMLVQTLTTGYTRKKACLRMLVSSEHAATQPHVVPLLALFAAVLTA